MSQDESSFVSPDTSPVRMQLGSSKAFSKPILKECLCDIELLRHLSVVDLFEAQGCASLLSPTEVICPAMVHEFYANFRLKKDEMVYSEI